MNKITLFALLVLCTFNSQVLKAQSAEKKITITYKGMTVYDSFTFEDSKGNPIVFHDEDQSFKSEYSLLDEELIGKKFIVTYKWVAVSLFEKSGLPTGKKMRVKRILYYELK